MPRPYENAVVAILTLFNKINLVNSDFVCNFAENIVVMSTAELRASIVHRLDNIYNPSILEEIDAMIDFISEPVYHLTKEQHQAVVQAQQAVARGEFISDEEMQKAVDLCLSEK